MAEFTERYRFGSSRRLRRADPRRGGEKLRERLERTRETVNMLVLELERERALDRVDRQIVVLDREALERIAAG